MSEDFGSVVSHDGTDRPARPFEADLHEHVTQRVDRELYDLNGLYWYCPTVSETHARAVASIADDLGTERVYDLGAGDLRLSIWLARRGYDVVAYEVFEELTDAVAELFDLSGVEVRTRDYYEDWMAFSGDRAVQVAFGAANKLPMVPPRGVGIDGYSEIGYRAWFEGERDDARWTEYYQEAVRAQGGDPGR